MNNFLTGAQMKMVVVNMPWLDQTTRNFGPGWHQVVYSCVQIIWSGIIGNPNQSINQSLFATGHSNGTFTRKEVNTS